MSHTARLTSDATDALPGLLIGFPMLFLAILPRRKFPYAPAWALWKRAVFGFGGLLFLTAGLYGLFHLG